MEAQAAPALSVDNLTGGQRLSLARRTAGIDQGDLATTLEVSRATVSRWERDQGEPTLSQAVTIAQATGWPLEWLAGILTRSRCFAPLTLVTDPTPPLPFDDLEPAPSSDRPRPNLIGLPSMTSTYDTPRLSTFRAAANHTPVTVTPRS